MRRCREFEDAYDRLSAVDFEGWLESRAEWRWLAPLASAHKRQDWPAVEHEARLLWRGLEGRPRSPDEMACFLNLAVTGADTRYHMEDRARWMACWANIADWPSDPYALFIRTLQEGCGHFFTGSLREALACFERAHSLAIESGYERGKIRSLLHLGLVARDQGAGGRARAALEQALELATLQKREALRARIAGVMTELSGVSAIEELFLARKFEQARALLISDESKRRARGLLRRRQSLYIYLPILKLWRGQDASARRSIARIRDPILKVRVMRLKEALFSLEASELRELEILQEIHGISRLTTDEICGIKISSIEHEDQRELLRLLMERAEAGEGGVDKEAIVSRVWGLKYDPVIHDRKAYKLIHALKKAIQIEDLILNRYGSYELNPKYLGQRRHSA